MPTTTTNLFSTAKKVEPKKATAKAKENIAIAGIEADILRYDKIKKWEANLKTEKEMIGGRIKDLAKTAYLKKYMADKCRPESFNITDGEGSILFIVMDAYKKVEEAKEAMLCQYPDLMETKTTYTINADLLDRCGEAVSEAIQNSPDISEDDKANLILATEKKEVKKGTIDRLLSFDNPELVFSIIEPTLALK